MAKKDKKNVIVEPVSAEEIKNNSDEQPAPTIQTISIDEIKKQKSEDIVNRYLEQLLKIK